MFNPSAVVIDVFVNELRKGYVNPYTIKPLVGDMYGLPQTPDISGSGRPFAFAPGPDVGAVFLRCL
jgi:hypothetical protein